MSTWNLDVLYTSYNSPEFIQDNQKLASKIDELNTLAKSLPEKLDQAKAHEVLEALTEYNLLSRKLFAYISLQASTNTTDTETTAWDNRISKLVSQASKALTTLNKALATVDLDACQEDELIQQHAFYIEEIKNQAQYMLSDEVEEAISKMELNASSAWDSLQSYMTSTVEIPFKDEKCTLSSIRNLAYSPDAETRKEAYYAELKGYDQIKDAIAFALNSIKGEANTIAELRGYSSVLDMTLVASRMKKETLDAMLSAMKKYLPEFHRYLKHKAKLLNHSNGLPFYDLFAPMQCKESKTFTIEEAKDYLIKNFDTFSSEVSGIVKQAYDEKWIDFYPRKGKVGGAFCFNLPYLKQSRVLTNFDGSLSDVVTLAHELGHAYHGFKIQDHTPLNTEYTMPVAETASTFNETIIMNAAIRDAATKEEKAMLIESMLQDVTQIICDIYSRYLFESEVIERRKEEFLFSSDLEEIMLKAQKEAYGDGLDPTTLHPFMWVCKSHYYSAHLNFYNFPYAFGGLFAKGLYAQFLKEGKDFVSKYNDLLYATTISSCEDVAKMAGIDLTQEDFWISSLEIMKGYIDQFIKLTPIDE